MRNMVVDAIFPLLVGIFPIDDLRDSLRMRLMTPFLIRSTRSISVFGFQEVRFVALKKMSNIAITINISTIVKPDFEERDCLFITNFYYLDQIVFIFFYLSNMKSIFVLFVLLFSVVMMDMIPSASAAILPPEAISGSTASATTSTASVAIVSVKAIDDMKIRATFTDDMDIASVRAKLTKQSDSSAIRVLSVTGVTDMPNAVDVLLASSIQEGSAYILTIISGVSTDGRAITDGALAIKDFITPVPLKKAEIVLNAPMNPNAVSTTTPVVVATGTATLAKTGMALIPPTAPKSTTGALSVAETKELPLTGMNPFLLLIVAFIGTYFFVRKRA